MKTIKLINLRELTTEEQRFIDGGSNPSGCELDKCTCTCICYGDLVDQKSSQDDAASGYASQQRELMQKS